MRALILAVGLFLAGDAIGACLPAPPEGRAIWSPKRINGPCILVIYDKGPGRAFSVVYDEALRWEGDAFYQKGTDGTVRRVTWFKLRIDIEDGLATPEKGFRLPFDDMWNYWPIRGRRPFTKWLPDGRLWQRITIAVNGREYMVVMEERFYDQEEGEQ